MRGELNIIRADGEVLSTPYTRAVPLQHLQDAVGGYIESVPYFTRYNGVNCVALCDEEGKMKQRPMNVPATELWTAQWEHPMNDCLVGDIVVLAGDPAFMRSL